MFGLLTRARRCPTPAVRSFRPRLERLETRFCPTTSLSLSMNYACTSQNNVNFTGHLSGAPVEAGQTITISGGGVNTTATTDANGNYSVTVPVTQLGNVSAVYMSGLQMASAMVNVNPAAPDITGFNAIQEPGGYWEFKGTVAGTPDPGGMTITFGGVPTVQGLTTTVAADGSFDVVFQLGGQTGVVSATTTDWWGRTDQATVGVA